MGVLAIPWSATESALREAGNLEGKIVVDCTNPLKPDLSGLTHGHGDSGGEQVARWAPGSRVGKAFNSTGFNIMQQPGSGELVVYPQWLLTWWSPVRRTSDDGRYHAKHRD